MPMLHAWLAFPNSNSYPFHLIERDLVSGSIVEFGRSRAFMRRHGLGVLERAARFERDGDPGRAERMTPDTDPHAKPSRASLDHAPRIDPVREAGSCMGAKRNERDWPIPYRPLWSAQPRQADARSFGCQWQPPTQAGPSRHSGQVVELGNGAAAIHRVVADSDGGDPVGIAGCRPGQH
jgi:hypothetical protein